jgi:hypothetical protein
VEDAVPPPTPAQQVARRQEGLSAQRCSRAPCSAIRSGRSPSLASPPCRPTPRAQHPCCLPLRASQLLLLPGAHGQPLAHRHGVPQRRSPVPHHLRAGAAALDTQALPKPMEGQGFDLNTSTT